MKLRTPLIRAALAATMLAGSFAVERVPAADVGDFVAMRVDDAAPVRATLMPELHVGSRAGDVRLDSTDPLPVTLLPTVHVTASAGDIAALPSFDDATALLAASD